MTSPVPSHLLPEPTREAIRQLFRDRGVKQVWVDVTDEGGDEACFFVAHDDTGDLDIEVRDFVHPPDLEDMERQIAAILTRQKIIVFGTTPDEPRAWSERLAPL